MTAQPAAAAGAAFAWSATAVILAGVLTAWADPIAGHCLNAMALAIAASWLIRHGFAAGTHWLVIPLLSVCAWGILQLSFHWTVYPYETWNSISGWLARAAVFYLAFATLKGDQIRDSILSTIVFCGGLLSIVATMQGLTGTGQVLWLIPTAYRDEVMGTFLNRDHYAVFVELILPIAVTRALRSVGPKLLYVLVSAILYASVVGSGSRAGTIFVSLEATVIIAVAWLRNAREYRKIMFVAGGMAICSLAVGWQYVWFRFHAVDLFAFRREMALATIQMARARPLTGFGLGTWPTVYPAFALFDPPGYFMNHAHNDWLEWMADGGVPFALGLVSVAYAAVSFVQRNLWSLGVPIALLHAVVDFPMQKPSIAALAFFLLGAAAAAAHRTATDVKDA